MPNHYDETQAPSARRRNLLTGPEWDDDDAAAQELGATSEATPSSAAAIPQQPMQAQAQQAQQVQQDQQVQPTSQRNMFLDAFPEDRPTAQPSPQSDQTIDQPQRRPGSLLESVSAGPLQDIQEKGFTADVASALGRGVGTAIGMTGRGLQEVGATAPGEYIQKTGEAITGSKMLAPDWREQAGQDGFVKRSVIGAAESIPLSLVPFMTAAAGGAIGGAASGVGAPAGALAGGAAGLGLVFGGGTYNAEKERATEAFQQQHPDWTPEQIDQESHKFARNQALWEVFTEGASDLVTFGVGKAMLSSVAKQTAGAAAPTLKSLLNLGPKEFAKAMSIQYLAEGGSELLAYAGQSENERTYGLGGGPSLQGALDTAAVSFWITSVMGGGMSAYTYRARNRVKGLLQSDNPVMQRRGLDAVEQGVSKQFGATRATEWRQQAQQVLDAGGTIDFNEPIFQAGQDAVRATPSEEAGGVLSRALNTVSEQGDAQGQPVRETRALSPEGEAVTTQTGEVISPDEIAVMEAQNKLAGMRAAGIPLDPNNPEHAELLYISQSSQVPSISPVEDKPRFQLPQEGFKSSVQSPEEFQELLARQKFEREAKEVTRLRNIPAKDLTEQQSDRLLELTGGVTARRQSQIEARKTSEKRKFEAAQEAEWERTIEKAERVDWSKALAGPATVSMDEEQLFERIAKEYTRIRGDIIAGKEVSPLERKRLEQLGGYVGEPASEMDRLLEEYQKNIRVPKTFPEPSFVPPRQLTYREKMERAVAGDSSFPVLELTADEQFAADAKDYNKLSNIPRSERNAVQQFRLDQLKGRLDLLLSGEYLEKIGVEPRSFLGGQEAPQQAKKTSRKTRATKALGTRVIKPGVGVEGERTTLGDMAPKEFQEAHRDIKKMSTITSNAEYKKKLPRRTERLMNTAATLKEEVNDLEESVLRNKKHLVSLFERAGEDSIQVSFNGRNYTIKKPSVVKDKPYIDQKGRARIDDLWVRLANEGLAKIDERPGERVLKIQTARPGRATVERFGTKTLKAAAIEHLELQKKLGEKADELDVARNIIESDIIPELQNKGVGHNWKSMSGKASFHVARASSTKQFTSEAGMKKFASEKEKIEAKHTKKGKTEYKTAGVSPGQAQGFTGKGAEQRRAAAKAKAQLKVSEKIHFDYSFKNSKSERVGVSVKPLSKGHIRTAELVQEWIDPVSKVFGINIEARVLSIDDFKNGVNVPKDLARWSKMNPRVKESKGVNGFMFQSHNGPIIVSHDIGSLGRIEALKATSTLAHEVGHIIKRTLFDSAPQEVQEAVIEAHAKWEKSLSPRVRGQRLKLAGERSGIPGLLDGKNKARFKLGATTPTGQPLADYLLSFDEWFANETAKAFTTNKKALSKVEKFFSDVALAFKTLIGKVLGTKMERMSMPNKLVADFVLGEDIFSEEYIEGLKKETATKSARKDKKAEDVLFSFNPDEQQQITDQDIADNLADKGRETKGQYASRQYSTMKREFRETADKFLGKISTIIKKYSPVIAARLRKMEIDILHQTKNNTEAVEGLMSAAKSKMSPDDYKTWKFLLLNHDAGRIKTLVDKYELQKEYKQASKALDDINKSLKDAGIPDEDIHQIWPRMIKDEEGLLRHLDRGDIRPVFEQAIDKKAKELGFSSSLDLPPDVRARVITSVILHGKTHQGKIAPEEKVAKIDPEWQQFFYDPDAAMIKYIRESVITSEYRKFFGTTHRNIQKAQESLKKIKEKIKAGGLLPAMKSELEGSARELEEMIARNATSDFSDQIGILIDDAVLDGTLDERGQQEVYKALYARFHEKGPRGIFNTYKNLSLIDTMGSFTSAITQIGDFAFTLYENGVFESVRAAKMATKKEAARVGNAAGLRKGSLPSEMRISTEKAGLETIVEEFADAGKVGKAVNTIFKLTGLDSMNRIARDTFLNATLATYEKKAKIDPAALKKEVELLFGKESASVVEDLIAGEVTDNVNYLVIDRLLDFQPITKSEMPAGYLLAGNGRLFYSLKSYTISQLNTYREEVVRKLKSPDKQVRIQGLKNLVRMSFFLVLANATADEIKDFILGREVDLQDRVIENILRLGGVSRFVTWQARREGVGTAMLKQIAPPVKFIDAFTKDIISAGDGKGLKTLDSVPLVGKPLYWRMGKGAHASEDLWDVRYKRQKKRLNKVQERLERSRNKRKFRLRNEEDLQAFAAMRSFQPVLNRNRRKQNLLQSRGSSPQVEKSLQLLRENRKQAIKRFLSKHT